MIIQKNQTIPKMFFARVERFRQKTALLYKKEGAYQPISWREFGQQVREVAAGLMTLGVKPGDKVAIMAYNRPEWAIVDIAIQAAGAITVPIYHTSTTARTDYILKKTGAKIAFVARSEKAEMLAGCSLLLDVIVVLDPIGVDSPGDCGLDYNILRVNGRKELDNGLSYKLDERIDTAKADACATIIFTSGTTGEPKGVMLSHANILANVTAGLTAQPVGPNDIYLSFLPLSHAYERTVGQYLMLEAGATIAYAGSIRTVADNILEVRPTIMLGVPRFFEKLYARILDKVRQAPAPRRNIFHWAMNLGRERREILERGETPNARMQAKLFIAKHLVFKKLKAKLGGRLRFFISGGAPLSAEIAEFFLNGGVQILEGYGLSEFSPVISVNRLGHIKAGTVGPALPGVKLKIDENGEILVKGPSIMLGYYEDAKATAEVIKDGWLATGDIGEIDAGYLRIVDRQKDIMVTSGGKNIAPQMVENLIINDEFISQVMLYGDGKKYITALVAPEFTRLAEELTNLGIKTDMPPEKIVKDKGVYDLIMARIEARCKELPAFERVKKIVLIADTFSEETGELTPTMKVKRKVVTNKFKEQLDALYDKDAPPNRWP